MEMKEWAIVVLFLWVYWSNHDAHKDLQKKLEATQALLQELLTRRF